MLKRCALILFLAVTTQVSAQTPTLNDISWISGAWQSEPGGRRQIEEHWTTVAGQSMLGMSRTVAGDKTVEF